MPTSTETALPDKDTCLALYRQMLVIRRCEEQLARSYQAGLIPGACHTYVGEEAIATGVCAHLNDDDAVFSTHRGHGHALAKGVPPKELIAELFGKATGCSQGRGGSMHLFSPQVGMMGTSGIVGPCILQAAGAGYSFKLLGVPKVGVAFFGDGAVANGAFHEGINLATNWQLPVLFVCENNLYATEVAFVDTTRNPQVANRAAAYGLPGIAVDGNDVAEVYAVAGEAITRARPRRRPDPHRVQDLSHPAPRRGNARRRLSLHRGDRRVERARPHPGLCPQAARCRPRPPRRTRRDHRGRYRADRRGSAICPRQPVARPSHRGRPRL